jgi:MFS family permease
MVSEKFFSRDYVLGFFAQFAYSSVFCLLIPTIPIYLLRLGSSEVEIGVLIGSLSASALIFRPLVGKALLRIPEKQFMIAGCGLYVLSSVAYLFAPPFWPMLVVRVFHGIGSALFSTAAFTLVANITPESHRGQLLSYYFVAINIAFTLSPYFGMLIINHLNFTVLFLVCTALSLSALIITLKPGKSEAPLRGTGKTTLFSREASPDHGFFVNIIWGGGLFPALCPECGSPIQGFSSGSWP